jgi:hypothetical protein
MKAIYCFVFVFAALISGCKKDPKTLFYAEEKPENFLSNDTYKKLIVQIDYVAGYEPTQAALNHLKAFLEQRLNKSSGIEFNLSGIASPGQSTLSLSEIKKLEQKNRRLYTKGEVITAYILFVDADYNENTGSSQVLGLAYGSSSMVIFDKTIRHFSGGITQPAVSTVEATVSEHEFAHILGLVNNGTGMVNNHQDEANGRHCNNSNCLMYYEAETSDLVGNLLGNAVPTLDNHCLEDLRANGGK